MELLLRLDFTLAIILIEYRTSDDPALFPSYPIGSETSSTSVDHYTSLSNPHLMEMKQNEGIVLSSGTSLKNKITCLESKEHAETGNNLNYPSKIP